MPKKSILFLLAAWIFGFIGLILGFFIDPMWFARFGSLVVLLAIVTEYILLHSELNRLYIGLDKVDHDTDIPDLSPSKWHNKKVWIAHFTVIGGTFIWGFGDLIYQFL
ncbi:hypothetical protein [Thiomicrorhabdus sp. Milos-T2]|uniref:hypothetical protein n=1 Tax=Thiomicrorhabdus sp. Milos-T2 TaxID=90814 RepID=UPI00049456E6|nr:hypothetical protein [Thiomicrorhabdus sp. Milos-T2]